MTSPPNSAWQPWVRVFALGLGFMFIFTNFSALQNLESSLFLEHSDPGIGSTTIAILYACATIGCTVSPFVLQVVGTKWCLVFGAISHAIFTAAHFCSSYFTLFPAAALLGFATGIVWTSQGKSVTKFAEDLASMKNSSVDAVVSLFNGVFFCCFMSAQIWGNTISTFILKTNANSNFSFGSSCGADYCPVSNEEVNVTANASTSACTVPTAEVQTVFGIFIGFVSLGLLLFLFLLPNLSRLTKEEREGTDCKKVATSMVGGLVFTLQDWKALLLTPLFFYTGYEQAILAGDFTKAFVTCRFGIQSVGLVMLTFGVCDAVASLVAGRAAKVAGQAGVIGVGVVVQAALLLLMQFKTPTSNEAWLLHLISGLWGVADACWQTQTSSLVGVVFPARQEMAFACYRLWQQLGFAFSFGTSPVLCTRVSLWIGLALLGLSTAGLGAVEGLGRRKRRSVDSVGGGRGGGGGGREKFIQEEEF